jgi:hypothetical protein
VSTESRSRTNSETSNNSTNVTDDVSPDVKVTTESNETQESLKVWAKQGLTNFYTIGQVYDLPCTTCTATTKQQIAQEAGRRQTVFQCCLDCGESEPLFSSEMYKWQQNFYLQILDKV